MLRNPGAINEVLDGIEKAAEHAQSTKHIGALSHTQEQAVSHVPAFFLTRRTLGMHRSEEKQEQIDGTLQR